MGQTNKYAIRWPAISALVKDGATAMRNLAEDVEAALLPPLLVTDGDGATAWAGKVAEIKWDVTDNPDRKRGAWDSAGNADQLVVPGLAGYYDVFTSVRFGGKAEPDFYDLQIRTRVPADGVGGGTMWATTRVTQPDTSGGYTQLSLSSLVRIADVHNAGIAIRLQYNGANNPPDVGAGINKLRVVRRCAL